MSRKILFLFVLLAITGQYGYSQWNDNSDWKSRIVRNDLLLRDEPNYPWEKAYFTNEWGEADYDLPHMSADLNGTGGWSILVDYVPCSAINNWLYAGSFRFIILNKNGRQENIEGPVSIKVRPADGKTYTVDVIGERGSIAFVEDDSTVQGLISLFNAGKLDIKMEFYLWGERHYCMTYYSAPIGHFNNALCNYIVNNKK